MIKYSKTYIFLLVLSFIYAVQTKAEGTEDATLQNGEIIYSYDTGEGSATTFGTQKAETYDVAIHITDKALTGKTVRGIRIPIPSAKHLSGLQAWLSGSLTLSTVNGKKVNVPDITTQQVDVSSGWIDVNFSTPYTITAAGVYAGYSFNVDTLDNENKYPIQLTSKSITDGFFIHSSRTYRKWTDMHASGSLALQVLIDGVNADAAGLAPIDSINTSINKSTPVAITLKNHGYQGISSYDYTYEINGTKGSAHVDLSAKVEALYNKSLDQTLNIPAIPVKGTYPLTINITKVNGIENEDAESSYTTNVFVYSSLPKHRAVLEEYTGTWCGWCPRGFIGLEVMDQLHPDDFIGISYHNQDPMEIMASSNFPSNVQGFPDSWLDRIAETDPYLGYNSTNTFGIDKAWEAESKVMAPADIDVSAEWNASDNNIIDVKTTVTFPLGSSANPYLLAYVLVADSLHGTASGWTQSNYYSSDASDWTDADLSPFTQGTSSMKGLYFSDVAIETSEIKGIKGSLSAPIVADAPQTHSYQFDVTKAVNTSGISLVQDKTKLHVVALLVNGETGAIVNAAKSNVAGYVSAVRTLNADNAVSIEYDDVSGRRIKAPVRGLYIKVKKSSDGKNISATKIAIR